MKLSNYMDTFNIEPKAVADYCGITVQAVSQYKLGKRFPKPEIVEKITAFSGGLVTWHDFHSVVQERKHPTPAIQA